MKEMELVKQAIEAREKAYVPYSHFKVGAAILAKNGKVFTGCNVECSSYGISLCAERTALVKAISEGHHDIEKIAVVAGEGNNLIDTTPCGACRQFLADFNTNMEVIMGYQENDEIKYRTKKLSELLPESFQLEEK